MALSSSHHYPPPAAPDPATLDEDDRLIAEAGAPPTLDEVRETLAFWEKRRSGLHFYERAERREAREAVARSKQQARDAERATAGPSPLAQLLDALGIHRLPGRDLLSAANKALVVVVMLMAGSALARSDAGRARPDPTFGSRRGWVITQVPGATSLAYGLAVIRGAKIVIAGQVITPSGNGQILVARYAPDGRLDRSFGSRGIFKTAFPAAAGPFIATSVVEDRSTRKLLIAGGYGQGSMLVMRLTPAGRLDRTFGRNRAGLTTTPVGGIAESIAIQPGGGILLGGSNANLNGRPMVVARFTRNGILDRRFGRGGLAQALFWNPDLTASAGVVGLATAPDGGVIASGHLDYIGSDGHGSAGVLRLSPNGRLLRRFGSGGHVEVAFRKTTAGFAQWFPCAMTVDSRGRITVSGDGSTGASGAILSARLSPEGLPDRSYGKAGNGRVVTPGSGSESDTTCGATSGATGELTVGVGSTLAQLRPDGSPNGGFARGGLIKIARPRHVNINAVALSGSRRVVVAGFADNAIYVARYWLTTRRNRGR